MSLRFGIFKCLSRYVVAHGVVGFKFSKPLPRQVVAERKILVGDEPFASDVTLFTGISKKIAVVKLSRVEKIFVANELSRAKNFR
ncbi:MAG: hypothetical protein KA713_09950 [Chryseotalea sp. WA131a]|nr:MAG: hypothetical protein KA713_09950 [Chryseotalea sp. WA131a]